MPDLMAPSAIQYAAPLLIAVPVKLHPLEGRRAIIKAHSATLHSVLYPALQRRCASRAAHSAVLKRLPSPLQERNFPWKEGHTDASIVLLRIVMRNWNYPESGVPTRATQASPLPASSLRAAGGSPFCSPGRRKRPHAPRKAHQGDASVPTPHSTAPAPTRSGGSSGGLSTTHCFDGLLTESLEAFAEANRVGLPDCK